MYKATLTTDCTCQAVDDNGDYIENENGEPVLADLPVVIEVVEHQVQVVVHLLRQVVHHTLLPIYHDLHVVLLYQ